MLIGGKYELAGVVAENAGWRTFQAREIISGRAVLVHQVLEPPALKDLEQRHGKVFDTCSSEGAEYVVTAAQPADRGEERFTRVGAWHVPQSRPAPPPAPVPAGPGGTSASGIFSAPLPQQEVPEPPLPAPPPPPVSAEPGDFTRLFQAPASQPAPAYSPSPAPPPTTSQEPGEFTRMFRAPQPVQSPPPPAPVAPPAAVASGEFTRFFQSPLGPATPEAARGSTPMAAPPATPPPPPPQPGEYTRLFQSPGPAAAPAGGSGATGAFLTQSVPASAPLPMAEAGPSDYTRMMQARPLPAGEAKSPELPAAAAPHPAPMKPRVPVWLVILLTFMGVVAMGMILYFALKH
jgi:hypothetical protein